MNDRIDARRPTRRIVLRYIAFQIPGWMLVGAVLVWLKGAYTLPNHWLWLIALAWVLKDIALFPLTWRGYTTVERDNLNDPLGQTGESLDRLEPDGRVRVQGVVWDAQADERSAPIQPGDGVIVSARSGLRLTVHRAGVSRSPKADRADLARS